MTNNNNNNNNPFQDFADDLGLNPGQAGGVGKLNDIQGLLIQLLNRVDYFREQGDVDKYQKAGSVERYLADLSPVQVRNFIAAIENAGSAEQSRRGVIGRRNEGESTDDYRKRLESVTEESRRFADLLRVLSIQLQQPLSVLAAHAPDDSAVAQYQNAQASLFRFRGYASNIEFGGRNEFYDAEINPHKTELRLNRARLLSRKFSQADSDDPEERLQAKEERKAVREGNAAKREEANELLERIMNNEELKERNPAMYQQRVSAAMSLLGELNTGDKLFTQRVDPFVQKQLDQYKNNVQHNTIRRGLGMDIDKLQIQQQGEDLKKLADDVFSGRVGIYENDKGEEDHAARQQAVQQILNLMRTNNNMLDKQTNMFEKGFGVFTKVLSALGVGQAVQRVLMSDPYQYTFQPAMGMLGSMGGMGSIVGGALSAQGAYDYGINSQAMSTGMGLVGGGAIAKMLFGGKAGLIGGIGMAGLGAGMIGAGVTGHADDVFKGFSKLLGHEVDQLAYQSSLGKSLMNPQALMSLYQNTLPTSTMWGLNNINGGSPLGFLNNGNVRQNGRGNTILDSVLGGSYNGISLQSLSNPTTEALNQAIQSIGSATGRTGANGLGQLSNAALIKSVLNGTSVENYAGLMGTARSFGSKNLMQDINYTEAMVANKDVNKTFASEVLVPALMKVTSSLTLRNISANGSELNKMVANYYRTITSGNSNFGKLAKENPELIGRFIETMEGSIKSGESNPAVMQTLMRYGIQPYEIPGVMNDPKVMQRFMAGVQSDMRAYGADNFDPQTGLPRDNRTMALMNSIGGLVNLSPENMRMLMQVIGKDGKIGDISAEDAKKLIEIINKQNKEDAKKISVDDLNKVLKNYNESTSAVTRTMQGFTTQVLDMQSWLARYINSDSFKSAAATGLQTLMDELKKVLGIKTPDKPDPPDPASPTGGSGGTYRAAVTGNVHPPGTPEAAVADTFDKLLDNPTVKKLMGTFGSETGTDYRRQQARKFDNVMNDEQHKQLEAAISSGSQKDTLAILKKLKAGTKDPGMQGLIQMAIEKASKTVNGAPVKGWSEGATNLLKYDEGAGEYLKYLSGKSSTASSYAGQSRSNMFAERGYTVGNDLQNAYTNTLSNYFTDNIKTPYSSFGNGMIDVLFDGEKAEKLKGFNDSKFIDKKIDEFTKRLSKLDSKKDAVEYLKVKNTLDALNQIRKAATRDINGWLPGGVDKYGLHKASKMANTLLTSQGGYIDPTWKGKAPNGQTYGGIGGMYQLSDQQIKENYSKGGWTGAGMKHEPAGVVHRGEVVIPSERIRGNEKAINALLAGEQLGGSQGEDSLTNNGDSVRLVMDVSGYTPAQLRQLIQSEIAGFAKDTKILYK